MDLLIKERHFSYSELLDMEMETFNNFVKQLMEDLKTRQEVIKDIQKNNPSYFMYTLNI